MSYFYGTRVLLFLLATMTLVLVGCDTTSFDSKEQEVKDKNLNWTADDYRQSLVRLDSLAKLKKKEYHGNISSKYQDIARNDTLSPIETAIIKHAKESRGNPQRALLNYQKEKRTSDNLSSVQIRSRILKSFSEEQRVFVSDFLSAVQESSTLEELEQSVRLIYMRARNNLSGDNLNGMRQIKAYLVGTAQYWDKKGRNFNNKQVNLLYAKNKCINKTNDTNGESKNGYAKDGSSYNCKQPPVKEHYTNYARAVKQGLLSFAAGCAAAGGVGFHVGGPIGAGVGCAIGGIPAGVTGYMAMVERQENMYKRAARMWCDECRLEYWKAAQFCSNELSYY
jgi:hypothetical protein